MLIGAHTSTAGGLHNALYEGKEILASTVQIFTSNQRQWKGRTLEKEDLVKWEAAKQETGISTVMSHGSYLINLASPKEDVFKKSTQGLKEELERCHALSISFLNIHPGAYLNSTPEEGLFQIVEAIKEQRSLLQKGKTRLLFETTAGQGSSLGANFSELAYLIQELKTDIPVGICLDTCHSFAAGYDLRGKEGWSLVLDEFEKEIGLKHLYALHVNDSKMPLGSHKDRHAALGEGEIGIECFTAMMQHPYLKGLPKYLETPGGTSLWKKEIPLLTSFTEM